jgi:hypothetical protein
METTLARRMKWHTKNTMAALLFRAKKLLGDAKCGVGRLPSVRGLIFDATFERSELLEGQCYRSTSQFSSR